MMTPPPKHVVSAWLSASNVVYKELQGNRDTPVDLGRSQTVLTAQTCAQLEGLSTFQVPFFHLLDLREPEILTTPRIVCMFAP